MIKELDILNLAYMFHFVGFKNITINYSRRYNMNKSDTINKLAVALVKAQAEMGSPKKDSANPFFKSKYADLAEVISVVKDPLLKHGNAFLQIVTQDGVETTLIHESGEFISGTTPVIVAKPNDPQALGSAITYARRYGLQAMLGIPAEDDDGEKAMGRTVAKAVQPKVIQKNTDKTDAPRGDMTDDFGDLFN
jgi:hypothetical protein